MRITHCVVREELRDGGLKKIWERRRMMSWQNGDSRGIVRELMRSSGSRRLYVG